ncbi:MAG TPA: hypothetical protein VN493_01435 [Thermoanaerobaculia bacterium]|nr:hypothetical protein [Thermoanaerobaculia bacterium]
MRSSVRYVVAGIITIMLWGCTTQYSYQRVELYGYEERRLADNTFHVWVEVRDNTPLNYEGQLTLRRCAELALEKGSRYFVLLTKENRQSVFREVDEASLRRVFRGNVVRFLPNNEGVLDSQDAVSVIQKTNAMVKGRISSKARRALVKLGRGTPEGIISTSQAPAAEEQAGIVYSEYFEFNEPILDGQVRMHLLITLGRERVPPLWRFTSRPFVTDGRISKSARAEGIAEEVYEIYFTNLGDMSITFSQMELQARPFGRIELSPAPMVLGPKQYIKTDPIVSIGSIHQPSEKEFSFRYSYAGETEEIVGVARRLRVDELK